ncbi:trypsin-like peptidase domain-containing protein [Streptomyces lutosisoli]|uniref:Trypsin-like peptidase domain-containing protein n=1 Tax=Streptomyces lutosisoli TaxID=2665721 RepID=A0ABW2VFH3_9ACTN
MASQSDRVVQIVGRDSDGRPYFVASGFLLAGDLAITAAHTVEDASVPYEVRPGGASARIGVRCVVPCADRDLALLVLEAAREAIEPVRFAELPHDMGQVDVHAVGYPWFTLEEARPRSHQLNGTVQLGSDRTAHQLQLSLTSSDPPPKPPGGSAWEGYSGAGVLTTYEGLLAGVVTSHRPEGDRRNLTGTDLCDLRDPEFLALLAEHGVEASPLPVHLVAERAGRATATPHWLPPAVRGVLARQRAEADELPYRFRQDRRSRRLTAVYIRQVLSRTEPEDPEGEGEAEIRPDARTGHGPPAHGHGSPRGQGAMKATGPPQRLEEVLAHDDHDDHHDHDDHDDGGHLLIEGGPGAGKSTLLHSCTLDLGEAALGAATGRGRWVPLWVTAAALADVGHSLESAVAAATGLDSGDGMLPRLPDGARWLVLVDALDEVHHDQRGKVVHRLTDRAGQDTSVAPRILLTTRPDPEGTTDLVRAGFHTYSLDPFDRHRLEEFARTWFKDSGRAELAADFLRQIDDTGLSDLLRNPLLATVTALVFENAPDEPLPDNRWALYEQYRVQLATAKRDQVDALWRELALRAEFTARGRYAVAYLREHLEPLLSHLAYAQVAEGARDLPHKARRWWEETAVDGQGRRFGAAPPLDGWSNTVTDALLGTGLLVRRGGDLEFLHATFAEHLAAERLAGGLPEVFDPGCEEWRTAILAASGRTRHPLAGLYRTALVHYGHRHRDGGRALLDWLQEGVWGDQLLAGELLAARCPANDFHYQRFVDAVEEGSASGRFPSGLLSRVRHPRVKAYLHDTVRRPDAPHRAEAAAALLAHDPADAVRALVEMAADPHVNRWVLQSTVLELLDSQPQYTTEAAEVLGAAAAGGLGSRQEALRIATILIGLGGPYVGQGATVLMLLAVDWMGFGFDPEQAVEMLIDLGEPYVAELARRLSRTVSDSRNRNSRRETAARLLVRLGEPYLSQGVSALRKMITGLGSIDRRGAVETLVRLGGAHVDEAAHALRTVIADPSYWVSDRMGSARQLARLGDAYNGQVAEAWRLLMGDPGVGTAGQLEAVQALARLGGTHTEEARRRVQHMIDARETGLRDRRRAKRLLADGLKGGEEEQLELWRSSLRNPRASGYQRRDAALGMAWLPGMDADEVATALLSLLTDGRIGGYEMSSAAGALRDLGDQHVESAVAVLRAQFADARSAGASRSTAARALLALGLPTLRGDPLLLRTVITDPEIAYYEKREAIESLRALGEAEMDKAAAELRNGLGDHRTDAQRRRAIVHLLRELGDSHVESTAAALRAVLVRPGISTRSRRAAARGLLALGGPHVPSDPEVLRALVTDRRAAAKDRVLAADALLSLDRRSAERERIGRILYALALREEGTSDGSRREAIALLRSLGGKYRSKADRAERIRPLLRPLLRPLFRALFRALFRRLIRPTR